MTSKAGFTINVTPVRRGDNTIKAWLITSEYYHLGKQYGGIVGEVATLSSIRKRIIETVTAYVRSREKECGGNPFPEWAAKQAEAKEEKHGNV